MTRGALSVGLVLAFAGAGAHAGTHAVGGGGRRAAPSGVSLKLLQPEPGAPRRDGGRAAVPMAWRVCPGTEESATFLAPREPGVGAIAVAWAASPRLAGIRATGERARGPAGQRLLLVHLTVPAGTRAGRYEGLLTVRYGATMARQQVAAEVLPFELMRPSKQYAVTRVPLTAAGCCRPEEADATALRRLREIGVGALCLDAAPADRSALEAAMRAAGLRGPVLAPATDGGLPPGVTAPEGASQNPAQRSQPTPIRWYALCSSVPDAAALEGLKASGGLVACRVGEMAAPEAGTVDLPIFDVAGDHCTHLIERTGPLGATTTGWWRWDAGSAVALENRLRCGALLWRSGLSGALVEISPEAAASADWPLRWEGVREGVLDSRYLTTLFSLIRQVKDKDRSSRLPAEAEAAVATALSHLARRPSVAAAGQFRALVLAWILRLGRVVWT